MKELDFSPVRNCTYHSVVFWSFKRSCWARIVSLIKATRIAKVTATFRIAPPQGGLDHITIWTKSVACGKGNIWQINYKLILSLGKKNQYRLVPITDSISDFLLLFCSYYASMLAKNFFDFFPACALLLEPARKENFQLFSNLLA